MKYLRMFRGELTRELIEMRRYPLESMLPIVFLTLMFVMIYFFAQSIAQNATLETASTQIEKNAAQLLAGYVVWVLVFRGTSSIANEIFSELQTGLLEQVFLSPIHPSVLLFFRSLAAMIIGLFPLFLIGAVIILITGIEVTVRPLALLPFILFINLGATGIGLALGGIALIYKRVYTLASVVIWSTLFLAAVDLANAGPLAWFIKLFPIAQGMRVFRASMAENIGIMELARSGEILWLVAGAFLFFAIGMFAFAALERLARKHGLLGQY